MIIEVLPDADDGSSLGRQNSPDLPQCRRAVREELQPLLTKDEIERLVWQIQVHRVAFPPFDRRAVRSGESAPDRQHGGVDVERSEERRVGKEWVSPCRSRGAP